MGRIQDTANLVYADGPSTDADEPEKSEIRDLFRIVDEDVTAATAGMVVKATWAELSAINGTRDGQPGRSTGPDAGTHTDPVVGGTVSNVGEFAWDEGDQGWQRVGDLLDVAGEMATAIASAASKATPADADTVGITDSADSGALKKITFANLAAGVMARLGALINGTTAKTTPVDADGFVISDSAASSAPKKLTWANLKAGVWSSLGALIAGGAAKTTLVDADTLPLADSAASNASKKITWANFKTAVMTGFGPAIVPLDNKEALANFDQFIISDSEATNASKGVSFSALKSSMAFETQLDALTLGNDLIYIGTAFDLEAVTPAGEIVQGTDKATGLPLVGSGGGGGVQSDLSLVTVLRSSDLLQIHFPQAGGRYVRWNFAHLVNSGQNSDVWQVYGVDDASLSGGVSTKVETICNAGQVEFAARPFGGSFTIGGDAHGRDEIIETPTLLIDGSEVDINGGNAMFTGRRVEIFQASQLLDSTDLSNFAKRYTRWVFEDGELELTNHLVIEKEIAFDTIYLSMLPILHLSGATEITHSGIRAPLFYPVEAFVGANSSETTADEIKLWGKMYSGEIQALEGWDDPGRESWVAYSVGATRNKIYFAPLGVGGEYTPALGSVLRMRSRLRVSIMNA